MFMHKVLLIGAMTIGLGWSARPAAAQFARGGSGSSTIGTQGFGMSPYASPYLNPYANPYLYAAPKGGVGATMVFLSAQQAQAQAAQQRAQIAREREGPRGIARSPMNIPGAGAARYFGGGSGPVGPADEQADSRFQRHGRYFQPNGR